MPYSSRTSATGEPRWTRMGMDGDRVARRVRSTLRTGRGVDGNGPQEYRRTLQGFDQFLKQPGEA